VENKIEKYVESTMDIKAKVKIPLHKPFKYIKKKIKKIIKIFK